MFYRKWTWSYDLKSAEWAEQMERENREVAEYLDRKIKAHENARSHYLSQAELWGRQAREKRRKSDESFREMVNEGRV